MSRTTERNDVLGKIQHLLTLPEGDVFMAEMADLLDPDRIFSTDVATLAYNTARRDVYRMLELLRDGALMIDTERDDG